MRYQGSQANGGGGYTRYQGSHHWGGRVYEGTITSACKGGSLASIVVLTRSLKALFVYDYYTNKHPVTFHDLFKSIHKVHQYNTRLASKKSYYLPKTRTNYGKFNIRFNGTNGAFD